MTYSTGPADSQLRFSVWGTAGTHEAGDDSGAIFCAGGDAHSVFSTAILRSSSVVAEGLATPLNS
jgi:hypothetical protein